MRAGETVLRGVERRFRVRPVGRIAVSRSAWRRRATACLCTRRGLGCILLTAIALCAILAPWLAPFDPNASSLDSLAPPSSAHWFGTDDLGRDVFSRVLYGARVSLIIGPGAAAVTASIGVPLGMLAGYVGGVTGTIIVQVIDLFIALPGLVLALIITVMVGPSLTNLVLVLGAVMWPTMARLVRGQTLAVREALFIEAAHALGTSPVRVISRHIWPNIMRTVAAQFAVTVSFAIFTSASLSFLGLGIPPPTADWGGMVHGGFDYLEMNPMFSLGPGAAVALTVLSFYLLGQDAER